MECPDSRKVVVVGGGGEGAGISSTLEAGNVEEISHEGSVREDGEAS